MDIFCLGPMDTPLKRHHLVHSDTAPINGWSIFICHQVTFLVIICPYYIPWCWDNSGAILTRNQCHQGVDNFCNVLQAKTPAWRDGLEWQSDVGVSALHTRPCQWHGERRPCLQTQVVKKKSPAALPQTSSIKKLTCRGSVHTEHSTLLHCQEIDGCRGSDG